jgi:hypothetical protein
MVLEWDDTDQLPLMTYAYGYMYIFLFRPHSQYPYACYPSQTGRDTRSLIVRPR